VLTQLLHLTAQLLYLMLHEILLKLDDFLRAFGPHELLREIESCIDALLGQSVCLRVDLARAGSCSVGGEFHTAVEMICFLDVLIDGLLGLGQGAFR